MYIYMYKCVINARARSSHGGVSSVTEVEEDYNADAGWLAGRRLCAAEEVGEREREEREMGIYIEVLYTYSSSVLVGVLYIYILRMGSRNILGARALMFSPRRAEGCVEN